MFLVEQVFLRVFLHPLVRVLVGTGVRVSVTDGVSGGSRWAFSSILTPLDISHSMYRDAARARPLIQVKFR